MGREQLFGQKTTLNDSNAKSIFNSRLSKNVFCQMSASIKLFTSSNHQVFHCNKNQLVSLVYKTQTFHMDLAPHLL